MARSYHFSKTAFKACDREGKEFMAIRRANLRVIQAVVGEFDRVRQSRGVSEASVLKSLRNDNLVVTKNTLNQYRRGLYYSSSLTCLHILAVWCGYSDLLVLLESVMDRERGIKSVG